MRTGRLLGTFGLFGLLTLAAAAQEGKGPAAGQPGAFVPSAFRAFIVVDDRWPPKVNPPVKPEDRDPKDRTGKIHDLVTENGLSPVVAIFVRTDLGKLTPDAGALRLAKAVNGLISQPVYRGSRLAGFVMFLQLEAGTKTVAIKGKDGEAKKIEMDLEYPDDEKRDEYAARVRDLYNAVKTPHVPFGLAPKQSKSAAAFGLKDGADVTVIIYNRLKIVNRWEFPIDGPTDEQIKQIIAATEEMVTGMKK
jgi:hypothetical protein